MFDFDYMTKSHLIVTLVDKNIVVSTLFVSAEAVKGKTLPSRKAAYDDVVGYLSEKMGIHELATDITVYNVVSGEGYRYGPHQARMARLNNERRHEDQPYKHYYRFEVLSMKNAEIQPVIEMRSNDEITAIIKKQLGGEA